MVAVVAVAVVAAAAAVVAVMCFSTIRFSCANPSGWRCAITEMQVAVFDHARRARVVVVVHLSRPVHAIFAPGYLPPHYRLHAAGPLARAQLHQGRADGAGAYVSAYVPARVVVACERVPVCVHQDRADGGGAC